MFENLTPQIWSAIAQGLGETAIMGSISTFFTVLFGLPLGILLFSFDSLNIGNRFFKSVLGFVVNVVRSFPYAILIVFVMPLTRLLTGTSIGPVAASVSLTIAAVPFFARLVETALRDIPAGKTDAALAMGSSRIQVVWKVWLTEARPTLIAAVTTTVVTLIGYSAMAGLIGGGGLGRLAYNYGYQRFLPEVMVVTVIILIALVQLVQWIGDLAARAVDHR